MLSSPQISSELASIGQYMFGPQDKKKVLRCRKRERIKEHPKAFSGNGRIPFSNVKQFYFCPQKEFLFVCKLCT